MKSPSKKSATKWLLSSILTSTLILTMAGCSNTDEENPKLEKTSDASLTAPADYIPASAEGAAQNVPQPRLPGIATENSVEGAEAALRYFIEAVDYARASGNTEALETISHEACDFCYENILQWSEIYGDGDWIVSESKLGLEVVESWSGHDEEIGASVAEFDIDLYQPASFLYEEGKLNEAESVESENVSRWHTSLFFDGTAQRWQMEWMYLSERDAEGPQ